MYCTVYIAHTRQSARAWIEGSITVLNTLLAAPCRIELRGGGGGGGFQGISVGPGQGTGSVATTTGTGGGCGVA